MNRTSGGLGVGNAQVLAGAKGSRRGAISLELVRQALGRRRIAFLQTTAIVRAAGQRIASEWPVCRLTELASPRRMGAAMTYARRYALFALADVAGRTISMRPIL
jgi:hypothetical protein